MTNKVTYKVMLVGYLMGILPKNEVIRFAEGEVRIKEYPDEALLELAGASDSNEIIRILNAATNDFSLNELHELECIFMGIIDRILTESVSPLFLIEEMILEFYEKSEMPLNEARKIFLSKISDDYYLRIDGFEGNSNVRDDISMFTSMFRAKYMEICRAAHPMELTLLNNLLPKA